MGSVAVESLAPAEASRLAELETIITKGLRTFVEVGTALREIRDAGLYRAEHATFADYCQVRWGYGRRHAYELMDAAEIAKDVRSNAQSPPGLTQAVALKALPPAERVTVAQSIDFATTTTREVRQIVREAKAEIERRAEPPKDTSWRTEPNAPEWEKAEAFDIADYPDLVFAPVPEVPKDHGLPAWFEAICEEALGRFDPGWYEHRELFPSIIALRDEGWWEENAETLARMALLLKTLSILWSNPTARVTVVTDNGEFAAGEAP